MIDIYVDADACPMKEEIYQVAGRHDLHVVLVANSPMGVPRGSNVDLVVVEKGPDAADDWIAEHVREGDIVVTADIPLAARCLEVGALVLGNSGRPFNDDMIGGALATRELMSDLREIGAVGGGPPPLSPRDRSRFLNQLDQQVRAGLERAGRLARSDDGKK
jgi:uncharacterized protein YaiI (UPF0178 family)